MEQTGFQFYCVCCHKERRIVSPAKIGTARFWFHILLTSVFFSLFTWPWMGWKGIVALFVPIGLVFEGFYRLKMRTALVCPECKFDPILYLVDRKKAAHQVELRWREKFQEKGWTYPEKKGARVQPVTPTPESITPVETKPEV